MEEEKVYYIYKNTITHKRDSKANLIEPIGYCVFKIDKSFTYLNNFEEKDLIQGPYETLFELKKQSSFFNSISKQKHKQRIVMPKYIRDVKDVIKHEENEEFPIDFIDAFHHVISGHISKRKVKGVHYIGSNDIKIVGEKRYVGNKGIYIANIKKMNENGEWCDKIEESSMFPDEWSINKLFHEVVFAFDNKKHISEKTYIGNTEEGIQVKFIINEEGKIITIYPVF